MVSFKILCAVVICVAVRGGEITLQSFNVGLNPRIDNLDERREAVIPALRENGSDVVCLQEVLSSSDVQNIVESLRDIYPYFLSTLPERGGSFLYWTTWPPCFTFRALSFATCAFTYCRNEPTEADVVRCIVSCGFVNVSRECISCVVIGGTFAALRSCIYGFGYSYNPSGLVMLSKRPLIDGSVTDFFPNTRTIAQRSYIKAEVENFGPIVCTHLTPNLGDFYLEPSLMHLFQSWTDQNRHEAEKLVSLLDQVPSAVIMGDLNTGPAHPENQVLPHMEGSYNRFVFSHWRSPFVDHVGTCTFCSDNVLTNDNDSWILDHVLEKGHYVIDTKLVHTTNIPGQAFPVSDHYGVEVTFMDDC